MRSPARLILPALCLALCACNDEPADEPDSDTGADVGGDVGGVDAPSLDVSVDASGRDAISISDVRIVSCDKEDDLSPNHSAADATVVQAGALDATQLYVCADTDDWFRVDAVAGQTITARIEFADRIGDLDLYLLPTGTDDLDAAVAVAGTREDVEELDYEVESDGAYFVRVHSFEGAVGSYDISIGLSCSGAADCPEGYFCSFVDERCVEAVTPECGVDEFEPNNHSDSATIVEPAGDGFAFLHGLTVCEDDDDYFVLTVDEPTTIIAELDFDAGFDLDLYVFDPMGDLVDGAFTDTENPEVMNRGMSAPGTYIFVVDHFVTSLGQDVSYNLTIEARPEACDSNLDCSFAGRQLCEEGACVTFDPETPSAPGELCDDSGDCVGPYECYEGGAGIDDNFCTTGCDDDGQCGELAGGYCLSFGRGGVCFSACADDSDCPRFYSCGDGGVCDLVGCGVDADCDDGQLCRRSEQQGAGFCTSAEFAGCSVDDDFEANDTEGSAAPVEGDAVEGLLICDANDDFFTFDVAEDGTQLSVSAAFAGGADLDVFIFDADGNLMASGTEESANPEVARAGFLAAGTYTIRVNQFPGDRDVATEYSLSFSTSRESCTTDGGECLDLVPLRIVCDEEASGACVFFDGDGAVELGGVCDSADDCTDDAEFCWAFEEATEGHNICTVRCREDSECSDVPDTTCTVFGRGFGACLPE